MNESKNEAGDSRHSASTYELVISGNSFDDRLVLDGDDYLIGRAVEAEIQLVSPSVSRRHARIFRHDGAWFIEDLGSRHGTEIGGVALEPNRPVGLHQGDRVVIRPYLIRVKGELEERSTIFSNDDSATLQSDSLSTVPDSELEILASQRLGLLMDSAASIHQTEDISTMADAVIGSLLAGTEFGRAFLLEPVSGGFEEISILGGRTRLGTTDGSEGDPISRTLLSAASRGSVVRLMDEPDIQAAVSIIGAGVQEALCVPVKVGEAIQAYLYLDASAVSGSDSSDAAAFCSAIGRLCGLAYANIQRLDLQAAQVRLIQELEAAQMVQKRMAPPENGSMAGIRWQLDVVPGTIVAGDLVCACADSLGRPMVFLGDVAGKGAAAGLLMAALEARLVAESERDTDLSEMIRRSNNAIMRVTDAAEFITLWTVIFDLENEKAHCVDSGHGYCVIIKRDGSIHQVRIEEGGPPIGVVADYPYASEVVDFAPGDRMVIFSDGLAEQQGPEGNMFEFERVFKALEGSPNEQEDVKRLYAALEEFAGGRSWQDDVTIMSVSHDS